MVLWFPKVSLIAMRASRLCPSMISVRLARVNWRGRQRKRRRRLFLGGYKRSVTTRLQTPFLSVVHTGKLPSTDYKYI